MASLTLCSAALSSPGKRRAFETGARAPAAQTTALPVLEQLSEGVAPVIVVIGLLSVVALGMLLYTVLGMTRRYRAAAAAASEEAEDRPLSPHAQKDESGQAW